MYLVTYLFAAATPFLVWYFGRLRQVSTISYHSVQLTIQITKSKHSIEVSRYALFDLPLRHSSFEPGREKITQIFINVNCVIVCGGLRVGGQGANSDAILSQMWCPLFHAMHGTASCRVNQGLRG